MKRIAIVLLALLIIAAISCAGFIGSFAWHAYRVIRPETFGAHLITTPGLYEQTNSIEPEDLDWFAYAYDENVFVDVLSDKSILPTVADEQGRVPAFRLGDDVFVITNKWINDSRGLAISNDENFVAKIESLNEHIRVWHLRDDIYCWGLDLERPRDLR
jgi:hypothetical protein